MKNKISKKTIALLAAAVLMLAGGGVMGTRAQLNVFSDPYNAEFALDHIGIVLVEDDNDDTGVTEMLKDVKLQPGKEVNEKITAKNTTEINQFVRVIVTKYWSKDGKKDPTKDPSLIKMTEGTGWTKNTRESTPERDVYYYNTALSGNSATSPVYTGFKVDSKVLTLKDEDGNLVYDGCSVNVKVEAQSVQTHNATDAIRSAWGVENITADENSLQLTVGR